MNDEEQLRTLSICHYVLAGITALFSCFFIIHLTLGVAIHTGSFGGNKQQAPPEFVGWLFVGLSVTAMLIGWTYSACMVLAGRWLGKGRGYLFCLVMAGLSCISMPLGTCLGVFTIIVLARPSVKWRFEQARAKVIDPAWDLA